MLLFHKKGTLYLPLAHSCSYRQVAVFCFDVVQFRNMVDVQDICWTGQAHIEQGDQALSSRQHFCIFSILVVSSSFRYRISGKCLRICDIIFGGGSWFFFWLWVSVCCVRRLFCSSMTIGNISEVLIFIRDAF